ncbi:hypothetical protein NUSPORA_00562 [Nucleospora cyclopteri]
MEIIYFLIKISNASEKIYECNSTKSECNEIKIDSICEKIESNKNNALDAKQTNPNQIVNPLGSYIKLVLQKQNMESFKKNFQNNEQSIFINLNTNNTDNKTGYSHKKLQKEVLFTYKTLENFKEGKKDKEIFLNYENKCHVKNLNPQVLFKKNEIVEKKIKLKKRIKRNKIQLANKKTIISCQVLKNCIFLIQKQLFLLNKSEKDIEGIKNITLQLFKLINLQITKKQNLIKKEDLIDVQQNNDQLHSLKFLSLPNINQTCLKDICSIGKNNQFFLNQYNLHAMNKEINNYIQPINISANLERNQQKTLDFINCYSNSIILMQESEINQKKSYSINNDNSSNKCDNLETKSYFKSEKKYVYNICELDKDVKISSEKLNLSQDQKPYEYYNNVNINNKIKYSPKNKSQIRLFFFGNLSSDDNENVNNLESEEEEEIFSNYIRIYPEITKYHLYKNNPAILLHKSADFSRFLNTEINFLKVKWIEFLDAKDDIKVLPKKISFSPGWNPKKFVDKAMLLNRQKDERYVKICNEYGLKNYFSLVYNMIQINTYIQRNCNVFMHVCFHLVCYHFCSEYNLGKGKSVKVNPFYTYYNFINNKNYRKLFKTKEFWLKKAEIIFKKGKEKALVELGITQSSFTSFHLYNVLHLLLYINHIRVAYVFYIYFATKISELDRNLKFVEKSQLKNIIEKRKRLYKIALEYKDYRDSACRNFRKWSN